MDHQFHKVRAEKFQRKHNIRKSKQRRKQESRPNKNEIECRGDLHESNDREKQNGQKEIKANVSKIRGHDRIYFFHKKYPDGTKNGLT
jgi:hypothetical protein